MALSQTGIISRQRQLVDNLKGKIKAFFVDLNGTVHIENELIPGAKEAVDRLRANKHVFRFVTNNSKEPLRVLVERLNSLGLSVANEEIYSSLTATRNYLITQKLRPFYFATEEVMEDFEGVPVTNPNAVVVALAPEAFNYNKLTEAFRLLLDNKEAQLIAVHKNKFYRVSDGISLGPGPFVEALEYATGKQAVVVGKPSKDFNLNLLEASGVQAEHSIMIGDDVSSDVIGALEVGMHACLVKTGKYRNGDELTEFTPPGENKSVPVAERALVVDSLCDVINMLT